MSRSTGDDVVLTGLGVLAGIGQGTAAFGAALLEGRHAFGTLRRPGRQLPGGDDPSALFLGAELGDLPRGDAVAERLLRTASLSSRVAVAALDEAWREADLDAVDPTRIGLVIGGSNVQQRELAMLHARHAERPEFVRPRYGMMFLDTDLCGVCTELYPIRGFATTVGGASASGLMAVLQAVAAVRSGQVDACVAVGALMDLSWWEIAAFRAMGAMGSDVFAARPDAACRPFDAAHDGFIFGEACGAVVVERSGARTRPRPYARVLGAATAVDGNRGPDPSLEGEVRVIRAALGQAGMTGGDIDYVNPHGTGSRIGDAIELEALKRCGLDGAWINATKSVTGHGLTAAGIVEVIATVLQLRAGRLHPTRNLDTPIDPSFAWVGDRSIEVRAATAISLSIGFGGINAAICLEALP